MQEDRKIDWGNLLFKTVMLLYGVGGTWGFIVLTKKAYSLYGPGLTDFELLGVFLLVGITGLMAMVFIIFLLAILWALGSDAYVKWKKRNLKKQ